jgi:hypothetical protein
MKLNEIQKDLIVGTLLGDGNLQTNTGQTWRYRALHKSIHLPYIEHKFSILKEFCTSGIVYSEILDSRTNNTYKRHSFNTNFENIFRFYGQHFYIKQGDFWVKRVPKDIKRYLTPRALAYWYMDDGALKWKGKSNAVRFCTDSFKKHEVELLGEALTINFQLKVTYQKKGDILRIATSESSYFTLKKAILDYLLPCMYYKFPDGEKGVYNGEDISNDIVNTFQKKIY